MMNYLNTKMSVFNNCKTVTPFDEINVEEFLNEIKDEIYSEEIKKLRSITDKKQRSTYKSSYLKTVCYAGQFQERRSELLTAPSNIIILDIDHIPESKKNRIKAEISEDKYTLAIWDSPSGDGLKVMVKMNFGFSTETYKSKYLCVLNYYAETYQIPTDDSRSRDHINNWGFDLSCSDLARQCIFSSDSEIYSNEDSEIFKDFDQYSETEQKVISIIKKISETNIDITETYDNWFKIGCALKFEFGEGGRGYYHIIGSYYPDYTEKDTNKFYDGILQSINKEITIATFFDIAKKYEISYSATSSRKEDFTADKTDVYTADEKEFNIPYEPFPIEQFPTDIRDYIEEVQQSLRCPIDFIGVSVLAAVSAAIGNTRMIQARNGHTESANLFLAIVAEPGSKKSPAIDYANIVIEQMQAKAKAEFEVEHENYKEELAIWEKENKKKKEPKPVEPSMKQYFVSDFTMEVLTSILSKNERGVLLISDELASWINNMNTYRKGSDKQKWLTMWSRGSIKVDRKSDLPIYIKNPFVSIIGGIQPEIIRDFNNKHRRDGFIDRLLFSFPERIMEYSETSVSQLAKDNYIKAMMHLYNYSPTSKDQNTALGLENKIVPVKMDDEANELWKIWNIQMIEELNHKFFPYYLQGAWSKLVGHTLRFALIFHCLNGLHQGFSSKVTKEDLLCAIKLSKYFKYQIFKMMSYCNSSDIDVSINEVYNCAKKQKGMITARQVYKNRIGKCKNAQDVEKIFAEMVKRKLGEIIKTTPAKGGRESTYFKITD